MKIIILSLVFIFFMDIISIHALPRRRRSKRKSKTVSGWLDNSVEDMYKKAYDKTNINSIISGLELLVLKYPHTKYAELAQFDIGKYCYLSERHSRAIKEFTEFLDSFSSSYLVDKVYYFLGLSYTELFDKDNAVLCFDKIIYDSGEQSDLYAKAFMAKGDLYFKFSNFSEALKYYNKAMENVKKQDVIISSLYYKLGKVYQKQGQWEKSKKEFTYVLDNYPICNEAVLIKKEMNDFNVFAFSVQVGCFTSKNNAYTLKQKLEKKGYEVFVIEPIAINDKFYKVRVGRFKEKANAMELLKKIRNKEKIKARIVP